MPDLLPELTLAKSLHRNIPETERIDFLLARDGKASTRNWVQRTLDIYRQAVNAPHSHASKKEYRLLFLQAIDEFEAWLGQTG